jgi:hypothetical protein
MMWSVGFEMPAWKRRTDGEQRWPAAVAIGALIALEWLLPERLSLGPRWLFPGLQVVIIGVIVAANPGRMRKSSRMLRTLGLLLIGVASAGNVYSVVRLVMTSSGGTTPARRPTC